jgi:hypothetical protein
MSARSYHAAIVAVAIGRPSKWLDNLLSHHPISGVTGGIQGRARRITEEAAVRIGLISLLARELELPLHRAVAIAHTGGTESVVLELGSGVTLTLDTARLGAAIEKALVGAVESVIPARRGRPPQKKNGTLG